MILIVWLGFAVATAFIANSKGRSAVLWLLFGIFFGVFALIAIACVPAAQGANAVRTQLPPRTKTCPDCAEEVREEASICRYCRHQFIDA